MSNRDLDHFGDTYSATITPKVSDENGQLSVYPLEGVEVSVWAKYFGRFHKIEGAVKSVDTEAGEIEVEIHADDPSNSIRLVRYRCVVETPEGHVETVSVWDVERE